jgi:hypothetical protein
VCVWGGLLFPVERPGFILSPHADGDSSCRVLESQRNEGMALVVKHLLGPEFKHTSIATKKKKRLVDCDVCLPEFLLPSQSPVPQNVTVFQSSL